MIDYDKYENGGAIHFEMYRTESWYKELIDFALNSIIGKTVLDLGCGDGLFCYLASNLGFDVTGVDNSSDGLRIAKNMAQKCEFLRVDLNHQKPAGRWDSLVCINTIEHLKNPKVVMDIFLKYVDQKMIIITDHPREQKGRYHFREYTPDELIDALIPEPIKEVGMAMKYELGDFYALEFRK